MKKNNRIRTVEDISKWRLCVGCGACAYICPEKKISLQNNVDEGIRPLLKNTECGSCYDCLEVCPGYRITHQWHEYERGKENHWIAKSWGLITDVWEGYAVDSQIRFQGSSAGLVTALALYCLEKMHMSGVVHIGADPDTPWQNKTYFSKRREELLSRTGSRYSPASPCELFGSIESASAPAVFIGKPCDISALRKTASKNKRLEEKIGCVIGIFCAGTPSTKATLELLRNNSINPSEIRRLRYRGLGWPGNFSVWNDGEDTPCLTMPYMEAWGFLQQFRPYRCYLCPDSTSEFADISCGDPWYRENKSDKEGFSLVCTRNNNGQTIINNAIRDGYIILEKVSPKLLLDSQKGMPHKRGAIWGRILVMRAFNIPVPKLKGFSLFYNWIKLPLGKKLKSIFGTIRRVITRKYYCPQNKTSNFEK